MEPTVNRESAVKSLTGFPYLNNYLRLSFIEWDLLEFEGGERIIFVGSGPFPLTSIILNLISRAAILGTLDDFRALCMESKLDGEKFCAHVLRLLAASPRGALKIELVDRSMEATEYAARLLSTLNLSNDLSTVCADGVSARLGDSSSVIYIASMVQNKNTVVQNFLQQSNHSLRFLIRGVEPGTLKELLYEPLSFLEIAEISANFPNFTEQKTFWPDNVSGVINSVHIFKYSLFQ